MNIDWSKAPEGATHVDTKFNYFCNKDGFYDSGGYLVPDNNQAGWGTGRYIPRPTEQPAWSGKGLPPVGTVCEVSMSAGMFGDSEWVACTILAHDIGPEEIAVYRTKAGVYGGAPWDLFRPIKSERDQQIDALSAILEHFPYCVTNNQIAAALYDKGVRVEK